ncbi:bifunctional helix-turn-helix transcriptional regulator/GNAT family N-acetyltransferase [Caulobacter sp. 17J80-11]|uniref:bifunctional helix-turn-helix transcriptional regulator/GNAT family N-acetyltransferase n=1 Tax=Caulobacter sp. 17J80-11 TaxID=2763502 RepID=UPI001653B8A3|nr:bifunctional helix-turn-helix transcriptional regulator/GNAT family N-acetyltransferase [Caulobacter sp. 17J80-11]MBC6980281.1 bifunctional helix-turn-helix transcriptional regulator/GNAT family N-acetyltransferase [Caulobacter sp. 17J80-11]
MRDDVVSRRGHLFLGSRLKRIGERMQADVARVVEKTGLPIQPAQYPLLATLDAEGPLTVNELADAVGISQPGATRSIARLIEVGLVETSRAHRDQRHKTVALTEAGRAAMARSKREVWPGIDAAVRELCAGLSGPLLDQLGAIEAALDQETLDRRAARAAPGLRIHAWSDDLAPLFHDINAEWIQAMFALEPTDRAVLEDPQTHILAPGGDILFVEADGVIVGTCALRRSGEGAFELTKMGVLERARGLKAGEFLLRAAIRRAAELGAEKLYLLTNARCAPAIHLYEKVGFVHDAAIMRDYGAIYERCDVAMRYRPPVEAAAA